MLLSGTPRMAYIYKCAAMTRIAEAWYAFPKHHVVFDLAVTDCCKFYYEHRVDWDIAATDFVQSDNSDKQRSIILTLVERFDGHVSEEDFDAYLTIYSVVVNAASYTSPYFAASFLEGWKSDQASKMEIR